MPNSAEVWANPHIFYLNKDGTPEYISGSHNPGDPFGEQIWGHAVYKFQEQPAETINFFIDNIKFISQVSPIIRLDNALSLIWKYYLINVQTKQGRHKKALKDKIFSAIKSQFPSLFFIAEDVGYLNYEQIDKPLQKLGIPGIRCPQWDDPKYADLSKYPHLSIAITSNHDTDSLPTWWQKQKTLFKHPLDKGGRQAKHGRGIFNDRDLIESLIYQIFTTKSQIAITSLRDIENDPRRYNLPGTESKDNWSLRMKNNIEDLDLSIIKEIITQTNRNPQT